MRIEYRDRSKGQWVVNHVESVLSRTVKQCCDAVINTTRTIHLRIGAHTLTHSSPILTMYQHGYKPVFALAHTHK